MEGRLVEKVRSRAPPRRHVVGPTRSSGRVAGMTTRDITMSDPERKALVVGINKYTSDPLKNCLNDASAVHEALKRMGFTSTLILDCDIGTLLKGKRSFVSSVNSGDIAFFYFAGHGVEAAIMQAGKPTTSNWLIARDVPESNEDLPRYALDAHNLLAELEARGARFNALVLDCCRNNPLPQSTRSLGGGGLAKMEPKGSLVAFACAPGEQSVDGPHLGLRHGVFTEHLLKHIETRGLNLDTLFIRVSNGVEAATSGITGGPQRPYRHSRILIENASLFPADPVNVEEPSLGDRGKRSRTEAPNGEASTRSLSRQAADDALRWASELQFNLKNQEGLLVRVDIHTIVPAQIGGVDTLKTCKGLHFKKINLTAPIDNVVSLMTTLTQLESLELSGCSLGFKGAQIQTLSDALRTCRLVHLDLSDNLYSQEEAVPLIESLPSTITTLALDYRVKSLDSRVGDPCKLRDALEQQMHTRLKDLKSLTFKVIVHGTRSAVPEELISAFVSLVKLPALELLRLHANFSRRLNEQPFMMGGMKVFREAVKVRDPSTPLVLELPEYNLCNPCLLKRTPEMPFFPYWEWDQWARCADGCTDWHDNLGPCARKALFCVQLPLVPICVYPLPLALCIEKCCCSAARFPTKAVPSSEAPTNVKMHRPTEDAEGEQQSL